MTIAKHYSSVSLLIFDQAAAGLLTSSPLSDVVSGSLRSF